MFSIMAYYARVLFTVDVPWWAYLLAGIVLAVVALSLITGRLGMTFAVLCVLIGGDIAFYSRGSSEMYAAEEAKFQRQADAEQARLKAAVAKVTQADQQHQLEAQAYATQLQQERDNALHAVYNPAATPGDLGGSAPCGIDRDGAARLYAIGKAHVGSTGGTPKHSFSAKGIR